MATLNELRKAGFDVRLKYGFFTLPRGAAGWPLIRAEEDAIKQFARAMSVRGLTVEGVPIVRQVKDWEARYVPRTDAKGVVLWTPTSQGIRPDHPWYQGDKDHYEVAAWCSRAPSQTTLEIPDHIINKYGVPKGAQII
jgi:hypothetical protein